MAPRPRQLQNAQKGQAPHQPNARTLYGEGRVSARRGLADEKSNVFSILLDRVIWKAQL